MPKKVTTKDYIEKAKIKHGDIYEYYLVDYLNSRSSINIICKKHGIFSIIANNHLNGRGCTFCGVENGIKNKYFDYDEFIKSINNVHNNKYGYSLVNYTGIYNKIKINCPDHGEFEQKPYHHLQGSGCPICKESKGEREIRKFLDDNGVKYINQHRFKDCKYKKPLPFDFYLPDYNICIEFDGRQHFELIKNWGGADALKEIQIKDKIKTQYCDINKIILVRIKYTEIKECNNILLSLVNLKIN